MSDFDTDKWDGCVPREQEPSSGRSDEETGIARVLRAAGGRARPSEDMKRAVRAAVHAEWRAAVARRRQRRLGLALAASVIVATLALWVSRAQFAGLAQHGEIVANVSRTIGTVQSRDGAWRGWHAVTASDETTDTSRVHQLHAGEDLMTGPDGRVALQLRDGVSLRLDHDTRIAFVDAGRIDVQSGAVYIDAGPAQSDAEHLRVGTPAGIIQHVGTQYEARIVNGGTRIRVREGRVDLMPEHGSVQSAGVGEQLLVSASGEIQRSILSPSDAEWAWAVNTAPPFDIDGRPVRDFLTWVGRELRREIVFATPETEAEADRAVLSGSIAGLSPAEALSAVLSTTQLRSIEHDGKIEIVLQTNH